MTTAPVLKKYLKMRKELFSWPEQLNRWPCHYHTHAVSQSVSDILVLAFSELSQTHVTFLTINHKDEEAYDQQENSCSSSCHRLLCSTAKLKEHSREICYVHMDNISVFGFQWKRNQSRFPTESNRFIYKSKWTSSPKSVLKKSIREKNSSLTS